MLLQKLQSQMNRDKMAKLPFCVDLCGMNVYGQNWLIFASVQN